MPALFAAEEVFSSFRRLNLREDERAMGDVITGIAILVVVFGPAFAVRASLRVREEDADDHDYLAPVVGSGLIGEFAERSLIQNCRKEQRDDFQCGAGAPLDGVTTSGSTQ